MHASSPMYLSSRLRSWQTRSLASTPSTAWWSSNQTNSLNLQQEQQGQSKFVNGRLHQILETIVKTPSAHKVLRYGESLQPSRFPSFRGPTHSMLHTTLSRLLITCRGTVEAHHRTLPLGPFRSRLRLSLPSPSPRPPPLLPYSSGRSRQTWPRILKHNSFYHIDSRKSCDRKVEHAYLFSE